MTYKDINMFPTAFGESNYNGFRDGPFLALGHTNSNGSKEAS